ncbi:hypothetical protein C5N14_14655 [Micromonospora sp. MW-13]|uniref:metallopeptidase TldD-related protein n=1 Tax=Micromonospora sp. MW-13 TaxID=2094022 RepID=UPI000E433FF1|nr:metallopeptidase TldD-related protein [Micromonospora sp. MW-13]RGC68156.1 hypothetical protein C5N14_14655 [Micromonospora sp. MW-13]
MSDAPPPALRAAGSLSGAARAGEALEVRTSRMSRRKHRITAGRVRSGAAVTGAAPTLVRLARDGREVHLWVDHLSAATAPGTLAEAREMLRYGRPYRDAAALHPDADWDDQRYVDHGMRDPDGPLAAFWRSVREAAEAVGDRLGIRVAVADALIVEEQHTEVFARSDHAPRTFSLTRIEARLLVEVRQGQRRTRLWAARHGNRIAELPVADLLTEAALRGAVTLAADGRREPRRQAGGALLLGPRPTAALLRVLANDLFDRPDAPRPAGPLRHVLVDDAHAAGGQHSRPFDHEGSPTGRTDLLDGSGQPTRMTVRGGLPAAAAGAARLTGNAYAPVGQAAPMPRPTNVGLAGVGPGSGERAAPDGFSGLFGFNLRGEGTQQIRAGDVIRFRVETAYLRAGAVAGRGATLFVAGTVRRLLDAIEAVSPGTSYVPWRDHSTACVWTLFAEEGRLTDRP